MNSRNVLGLDIGGANLKAADNRRRVLHQPFALWKSPEALSERIRALVAEYPDAAELAVVMTGELCDCFATKAEGVAHIIRSVRDSSKLPIRFWTTEGTFVSADDAMEEPQSVAAANWHALATFAGRLFESGHGVLIDIGSTTADLIPLFDGKPVPHARTDPQRLRSGELVYAGVRRTPLCALFGMEKAAEFFATTDDVYLLLEETPEKPKDSDTADGRPRTRKHAHARIARMECDDAASFSRDKAIALAAEARDRQLTYFAHSLLRVLARMTGSPRMVVTAGEGEFLTPPLLARAGMGRTPQKSFAEEFGPAASAAACAYAVAVLAQERPA